MYLKLFILSVLMGVSIASNATDSINTSDLSPAQIEEIKKQVSDMKATASTPLDISRNVRIETEAWKELGANMGKAMVGAAKEVGVATSDFASTSLGKVIVFIVVYKLIGASILGVIFGTLIIIGGTIISIWIFKSSRWSKVKYIQEPAFWGLYQRRVVIEKHTDADIVGWQFFVGFIMLFMSILIGLKLIF